MPLLYINTATLLAPGFNETGSLKRRKSCAMMLFNK